MSIATFDSGEARARWKDIMDAARAGEWVVIAHYNRPTAAVIHYADFLALQEELDDLRAGRRAAAVYAAWQADPSRGVPYEEVRAELVSEGALE